MELYTFPPMDELIEHEAKMPGYMRPNHIPYAVAAAGYLSDEECDRIILDTNNISSYTLPHCGATTRECGHLPCLNPIRDFALVMNDFYWNYDLDETPVSWRQSYTEGETYQMHADAAPAQMRKLTAVCMLTEERRYQGGQLEVNFAPLKFNVPKTRGTIVVFQSWLLHEVKEVTRGVRETINMGFWGPPFR